ncbi:unnamed protein product [Discosporangium mesarthrocarpum]
MSYPSPAGWVPPPVIHALRQRCREVVSPCCSCRSFEDFKDDGFTSSRKKFCQGAIYSSFLLYPRNAWSLDAQRDAKRAQPPPPALLLPVSRIMVAAEELVSILGDPAKWEEARRLLDRSRYFQKAEFKAALDRYSDSNWEKHMLGDLHRNEGLDSIKAMDELLTFMIKNHTDGNEILPEDIEELVGAGQALIASLRDFMSLAPTRDAELVLELARGEGSLLTR